MGKILQQGLVQTLGSPLRYLNYYVNSSDSARFHQRIRFLHHFLHAFWKFVQLAFLAFVIGKVDISTSCDENGCCVKRATKQAANEWCSFNPDSLDATSWAKRLPLRTSLIRTPNLYMRAVLNSFMWKTPSSPKKYSFRQTLANPMFIFSGTCRPRLVRKHWCVISSNLFQAFAPLSHFILWQLHLNIYILL